MDPAATDGELDIRLAIKERKRYDFRTSHCLYRKPAVSVSLETRVDSKDRNVGFLALSGR